MKSAAFFFAVAIVLVWFLGGKLIGTPTSGSTPASSTSPSTTDDERSTAVDVEGVYLAPGTNSPVVVLRERDGERSVPIWIGFAEAEAIRSRLAAETSTRPMTHDLLGSAVEALGGRVTRAVITALREGTYYARIDVKTNGDVVALDARPSDAIALALETSAPIFVVDGVIASAAEEESAQDDIAILDPGAVGCGIWCQPIDEELASALGVDQGVIVSDLTSDQDRSGILKRGDVILNLAGQDADSVERVRELLSSLQQGDSLPVTILRAGESEEVTLECR